MEIYRGSRLTVEKKEVTLPSGEKGVIIHPSG